MNLRLASNLRLLPLLAAFPVLAADGLNVKTGTWETTVLTKTSGMQMPAGAMANMTPQQKAQMEAMMSQMGAGGAAPKPITQKSCVTEKDLKEGAFRSQQENSECNYKQVASSGNRQEWTFECPSQRGASTGRMVVNASDNSHVSGEMHIKTANVTIDSTFTSKWLGATCAAEDKD